METIDRTTNEILERLERLRRETADREAKLREWAQCQPKSKLCGRHQHQRPIDWTQSRVESWREGEFRLAYEVCPACRVEEEMLRESRWLHERGVPLRLCHAKLRNFKPRDESDAGALQAAEKFSRRKRGFLILSGRVGAGKSHLGVAIMRERRCGLFMKHGTLLEMLRATYRDKLAPDPVEMCRRAKFLVLDDLGTSSGGADDQPALHSILDHRHGENLPTVITTNLPKAKLVEELGDRVFDRIREVLFKWVELNGESKRGEAYLE
jgi:DNA replication protein DnaC